MHASSLLVRPGASASCARRSLNPVALPARAIAVAPAAWAQQARLVAARAEPEAKASSSTAEEEDPMAGLESDSDLKKKEAERLRAAEKFMTIGSGNAECKGCGYEYKPENGDPDFPIAKGIRFEALPDDYFCPICGAGKDQFKENVTTVAGFAENQKYGFGTNSMTGSDKTKLIYGALAFFFVLFIAGYGLE